MAESSEQAPFLGSNANRVERSARTCFLWDDLAERDHSRWREKSAHTVSDLESPWRLGLERFLTAFGRWRGCHVRAEKRPACRKTFFRQRLNVFSAVLVLACGVPGVALAVWMCSPPHASRAWSRMQIGETVFEAEGQAVQARRDSHGFSIPSPLRPLGQIANLPVANTEKANAATDMMTWYDNDYGMEETVFDLTPKPQSSTPKPQSSEGKQANAAEDVPTWYDNDYGMTETVFDLTPKPQSSTPKPQSSGVAQERLVKDSEVRPRAENISSFQDRDHKLQQASLVRAQGLLMTTTTTTSPTPGIFYDGKCGIMEKDMDYLASGSGPMDYSLAHIPEPEMCCAMCQGIQDCTAWVWKDEGLQGCPFTCWILTESGKGRNKKPVAGVVSGMPPQRPLLRIPDPMAEPLNLNFSATKHKAQDDSVKRANCASYGENCWNQLCCQNLAHRCYMKNSEWAGCRETCIPGINPKDPVYARTPWECKDVTRSVPQKLSFIAQEPPMPVAANGQKLILPESGEPYVPLKPLAPEATKPFRGMGPWMPGSTLFCFSLIRPDGYETDLLKMQQHLGASIFSCELYTIYSNRAFQLTPGTFTSVVATSLDCPMHEIAWNTGIFIAVWRMVIKQGWYRRTDYVVKVDPDAVFFPSRLRPILLEHSGMDYLVNCKFGLHGPIEVLSQHAVDVLAEDYAKSPDGSRPLRCLERYPNAVVGNAQWGEDMFLDFCLRKVLGLKAVLDERLVCEAHCDCPDWYWCHNGSSRVSYHPFKRADLYEQCIANAMHGAPDP